MSRDDRNNWISTSGARSAYKNPAYEIHLCAICIVLWCGDRRIVVANFKDYEPSLHQYTKSQHKENALSIYTMYDNMFFD